MKTKKLSPFDDEDIISNLPDNLINHILSFLDIKYVLRTSGLSRRWRCLWKSLSTLNIDDGLYFRRAEEEEFNTDQVDPGVQLTIEDVDPGVELTGINNDELTIEKIHDFVNTVNRVLSLRESSDIQRLNLVVDYLDYDIIDGDIHRWILAAVTHNVQELCLFRSTFGYTFEIPHCLFSCKSLTKLEMRIRDNENGDYTVVLPSSMSLPRLKSLRLDSLLFLDERLTNMLFSSCPVLESLILEDCEFRCMNLNISSPTLKHFELSCYDFWDNKVNLYAPNLTSFICEDFISKDYTLGNLSSLVTADITLSPRANKLLAELKELFLQRVVKFLRALHNVKVLTLSPWILQVLSRDPEILESQPTQFFNLQRLKLWTILSRDCMDSIIHLLNNSPNIVSLSLQIQETHLFEPPILYPFCDEIKLNSGNIEVDYWEARLSFSPCMWDHLKFVEIRGLLGRVNELKFLEILLKNALVLEKLVLFSSTCEQERCDRERRMMKFSEMLLSFPRASASTEILFSS